MKTDSIFFQLLKNGFPNVMEMAGFSGVKPEDYKVESVELKGLNRRMDGMARPRNKRLPLVAIEFYGQKNKRAYRNLAHKLFWYMEDHKWEGRFQMILIFANESCDPKDEMFQDWENSGSLVRIHLKEWLTLQPETPYYDCLRSLVGSDNIQLDMERWEKLDKLSETNPTLVPLVEIFQNILLNKYNLNISQLFTMLNINQPFDITKLKIYKPLTKIARQQGRQEGLEKGLEKGREEGLEKGLEKGRFMFANNMIDGGFDDDVIHKMTGLSLKKIQELRQKRQ